MKRLPLVGIQLDICFSNLKETSVLIVEWKPNVVLFFFSYYALNNCVFYQNIPSFP